MSIGSMDSVSQPTQLLEHALAPAPQSVDRPDPASPTDGNSAHDFSLDSRVIPVRSVIPRYSVQSPSDSGGRVLIKNSQKIQLARIFAEDGSELFPLGGDSPISADVAKVIGGTRVAPPPSPPPSQPTKSMPVGSRHYRRSPSYPSQDSFAEPISQDPAEQYLASAKQFDVPLSDLGETPTQEVIHSPTDPGMTLPDASEHKEFLEAAMRKYETERANRLASNRRPKVLVVASPSNSGESSGTPHHKYDDFSFHKDGLPVDGQQSRFQFNGSSSFDKMLDRDLTDATDPTPPSTQFREIEPPQADGLVDVECTKDDFLTTPPRSKERSPTPPFEWIVPSPNAAVASSNPRSLLRMVHPGNQYRIAKMKNMVGNVEPRSCNSTGAETQPSHPEETQPCHATGSTHLDTLPPTRPAPNQTTSTVTRPTRHQPRRMIEVEESDDALDIVPDSEPPAGPSTETPSHDQVVSQSPLKKSFRPLSPASERGSADFVSNSVEAEESEADVPLAIEIASGITKKYVAPMEKVTVHGRKARTGPSVVPEKVPTLALERQPQRPASSSTRKDPRVKPSKTEPAEIPTSLPEEDLEGQVFSSRQPHTSTTNRPLSKNKIRAPETLQPSREHTKSTCPAATRSFGGNKRSHKSDSESSEGLMRQLTEDEGPMDSKMRKEEEEESGSTDDEDFPPPPPPKPDPSRKKRRRIEDVNPLRGLSKASVPTRSKASETPAVATRSAKRLRSAVSSARGFTAEPATRVFALWKQDGHYYSGVIYSRGPKNKHLIRFDDGTEDEVELKNMRRRELLVGDRVIIIQDNIKGVVSDVSNADSHGSFTLEASNGVQTLGFREIRIATRTIQSQWKERTVPAENIVTVVRPKPPIDTTPSKQSITSTASGKVKRELVKTGFVVTINPKNEEPVQTKDKAMHAIQQQGGLVIEDWSSVFMMEGKHSQSNKRWIATPQDFRFKSEVNLDRVFLLSDDAHQKPKFLLALALGIPCLSFEWLTRGGKFSSDWQPFLLPAGYSDILGARVSQLVDLDWGNCTEHLTDIMESEVPIKLFSQKTVLCVGAELVPLPLNRARKNNTEEASRYVPWIILCMGASKVEAVTDTKQVTLAYMQKFDYIVVKEHAILGSLKLGEVVVGDVNWVKECLVSSRLSSPKLD